MSAKAVSKPFYVDGEVYGVCVACHAVVKESGKGEHARVCKVYNQDRSKYLGTLFRYYTGRELNAVRSRRSSVTSDKPRDSTASTETGVPIELLSSGECNSLSEQSARTSNASIPSRAASLLPGVDPSLQHVNEESLHEEADRIRSERKDIERDRRDLEKQVREMDEEARRQEKIRMEEEAAARAELEREQAELEALRADLERKKLEKKAAKERAEKERRLRLYNQWREEQEKLAAERELEERKKRREESLRQMAEEKKRREEEERRYEEEKIARQKAREERQARRRRQEEAGTPSPATVETVEPSLESKLSELREKTAARQAAETAIRREREEEAFRIQSQVATERAAAENAREEAARELRREAATEALLGSSRAFQRDVSKDVSKDSMGSSMGVLKGSSLSPSMTPSMTPSINPSINPSMTPSINPSMNPSITPSRDDTKDLHSPLQSPSRNSSQPTSPSYQNPARIPLMAYQSPSQTNPQLSRQLPADPRISLSFDPFPQDETPEPLVPPIPLPAIQETEKNPFGDEAETLAKLGGKTAPAGNNPFDHDDDETSEESSGKRNPFDETDDESSAGNPFDKETPSKNPFDETPAKVPANVPSNNPFDEASSDETPSKNPFDEPSSRNPFDETPVNVPANNPFNATPSNPINETPTNPFNETTPSNPPPETPSNTPPASNPPESRRALIEQQETAQLAAIRQSFAANEDEWKRALARLTAGVKCVKWCSNGTSHKTVLRVVRKGDSFVIEWERKKGMLKAKNGSIDVASVSSVQNVAGTNKFVIEATKQLVIECFNNNTKISILPVIQRLCEHTLLVCCDTKCLHGAVWLPFQRRLWYGCFPAVSIDLFHCSFIFISSS